MRPGPHLQTAELGKRFGGLVAVSEVGLSVARGEIHALIGPNGAGKTTLLNLLSGELVPSTGRVVLAGEDVTGWQPDALARAGLGRSFQHSSLMGDFSLLENVELAAQARLLPSSMRFFRPASSLRHVTAAAREALELVGLSRPSRLAAEASHGEQRQLEIAMLIASRAEIMLLDEPTSGMGREETGQVIRLLEKLRGDFTILLVEHDMDVVFSLADRITVLVYGKVLASGSPAEVRRDPAVRSAYLGRRGSAA